jgi:hypothetical protein
MPGPKFELVTELHTLTRRDFYMADESLLKPLASNPLYDGEWLALDANYKLARGTGNGAVLTQYPVHVERGRYDTQAIGKVNVIFAGSFEADTQVFDATGLTGPGQELMVADVTVDGVTKRGLKLAASGAVVVAVTTKAPASGKLRFQKVAGYVKA